MALIFITPENLRKAASRLFVSAGFAAMFSPIFCFYPRRWWPHLPTATADFACAGCCGMFGWMALHILMRWAHSQMERSPWAVIRDLIVNIGSIALKLAGKNSGDETRADRAASGDVAKPDGKEKP